MLSNTQFRPNPRLTTIIFDLDDTLISWANPAISWLEYLTPFFKNMHAFLTEAGYEVDLEQFGHAFGRNTRHAWAASRERHDGNAVSMGGVLHKTFVDLELPADEIDMIGIMKACDWQPFPGVVPYPDAHEVLDTLRAQGYKVGLLTNSFQPMWMRDVELEAYEFNDRFDARITSGDTGFMKPHPAVFWRILGMLDSTAESSIYVGDSPSHDVRGANESGMVSVQIDPPHLNKRPEKPIEQPDYTITSLSELLPLVEEINKDRI